MSRFMGDTQTVRQPGSAPSVLVGPQGGGERTGIPGLPPLLACLALLLVWDLTARLVGIGSLPSPWPVLKDLPALLSDHETLVNIFSSMRRMATGFALAVLLAIPLGLVMG